VRDARGSRCLGRLEIAVQDVRVHVRAVRPHDRPKFLVDTHLAEEFPISAKWLEYGSPELAFKIDLSRRTIVEGEPYDEAVERFNRSDPDSLRAHGNGAIVSSGWRARAVSQFACSSGRCSSALADEPERSRWERADQRLERFDHDLRLMLAVDGVEVRRLVVAVVHRDHDPIEGADARHGFIVAEVARFEHCLFWLCAQPMISSDFAMQCSQPVTTRTVWSPRSTR